MKKANLILLSAAMMLAAGCSNSSAKTVAIIQLGTHTSLNEIHDAIVAELEKEGIKSPSYKIVDRNAEFSLDVASQIMTSIRDSVDLAIAIATPIAQAAYNGLKESTPIVFAAVSDPVGAGLVVDASAPEGNITGTSDEIQVSSILDKAVLIDPELDELGFIYNPGEANSVTNLRKVDEYCKANDITLRSVTITSAGEMSEIATSLISRVDAIFVSDDNTVASAMTALSGACRDAGKPCYVGADSMVKDGGMLCLGINYTTLGTETAKMAGKVLSGTPIKDIPIKVFNDELSLYLNMTYLEETGIEVPSSILNDPNLVKITETAE